MLDVVFSTAVEALKNGQDAAKAAVNGAHSTQRLWVQPVQEYQISNYVNEDALFGIPVPGAVAFGLVFSAVYETIA